MSDPFDRLRDALGDVAVPDQWSAIESRAAAGDLAGPPPEQGRTRTFAWWAAAAAALALVVTGIVVIANRDTAEAPASPGETVPPPATAPATQVSSARALPCMNESDLAAIVAVFGSGTAPLDYGQHSALHLLGADAHVVLVADVATVGRVDGWRRLSLSGSPTYFTGEGPVDAISERAPWDPANGVDPIATPVQVDNVRVAAALQSLSSAPVWTPGLGGLIVGCAGVDVPAIDMHNGSTLFGDPSIDEIAGLMANPEAAPTVSSTPPTAPESTVSTTTPASPSATGPSTTDPTSTTAASRTVTAHWGSSAQGQAGCDVPECRYLNAIGTGFEPGATVTAACWGDLDGEWRPFSAPYTLTVSPDGSVALGDRCYFGYPGRQAKVVIDGVESGAITN